jgi:predicted secreted Zn-dependent protease
LLEVEFLMISCRPHYLPREFSSILFVTVYLPPQTDADTKTVLNLLYKAISKQEKAHPEAALLVARDFNAGKLKSIFPHFYQHVTCATRGKKL